MLSILIGVGEEYLSHLSRVWCGFRQPDEVHIAMLSTQDPWCIRFILVFLC